MKRYSFLKLFFIWCLLAPAICCAQAYPSKPQNYITDEAGVLDQGQLDALNTKLKSFEDSTSNQVFVYVTSTLGDKVMAEYCQEIFHDWKIGSEKNNGVLIAIFVNDHKFRIHTGYGMEGALPDALTKRIQDNEMKPSFKENNYYEGINKGIDKIIYYSAHEYKADEKAKDENKDWLFLLMGYVLNIILFGVVLYTIYRGKKSKENGAGHKFWLSCLAFILLLIPCAGFPFLIIMMYIVGGHKVNRVQGGNNSTTGYDSSSSWSSSDSSDSSSSFDGGGGGDSGGGGSDSSW
jgi:uncharacterized protein